MEWMILPLKRYAEFQGRSRRQEYWMFYLFQILISVGFNVLGVIVGGTAVAFGGESDGATLAGGSAVVVISLLSALVSLGLFIPSIAVGVRRLHDTDRTGWWLLAPAVPFVVMIAGAFAILASIGASGQASIDAVAGSGIAVVGISALAALGLGLTVFIFLVLDGTRGPNRFGPDPKNPEGDLNEVFR